MCRVQDVVVVGAGADACATKGVLGDAGTACDSERGGMADGRATEFVTAQAVRVLTNHGL